MENAEANTFPVTIEDNGYPSTTHLGLTKREYFAGLAMQGLLANSAFEIDTDSGIKVTAQYTISAVKYADELLKQLEK